MTRYSLSEIEAMARKAARGAGYPWGLAEETGHAVRWLEASGTFGLSALAGLLEAQDGCDYAALRPESAELWHARGEALCPIIAGATLADYAPYGSTLELGPVRYPLLLLPFSAWAGLIPSEPRGALAERTQMPALRLEPAPEISRLPPMQPEGRAVPGDLWLRLDRFARRTYVPATPASRAGAGAGETDND